VNAVQYIQTNQFDIAEGEMLSEETWIAAQTIRFNGEALNDFFATAPNIQLNGTFQSDTWVAGDNTGISGIFQNDLRIVSRTARISGMIHGTLIGGGTTIQIDRTAKLHGDVFCFGENVISEGILHGEARIIASKVTLGGQFDNDVTVAAQDIVVLPGTVLNGNLNYTAPKELILSSSVLLNGELNRQFEHAPTKRILKKDLAGHFGFAAAALFAGLTFFLVFPRYMTRATGLLQTSRGTCALSGFAGLVLIPIIVFFLLITFIGLPLSLLLGGFYLILLYLSKVVVGLWIGALILRKKELSKRNVFGTLALGLILMYVLTSIAVISLAIQILIMIFGLGALLLALFKKPAFVVRIPETAEQKMEE
jgi:cytoskeletal protein CcmA (bactofilin family)